MEKMTQTRNYSQAAGLLQGVTNVIEHLELYSDSVEEIRSLSERMAKIRRDLASHVTADFNEAFSSSSKVRVKMPFLENPIKFGAFEKGLMGQLFTEITWVKQMHCWKSHKCGNGYYLHVAIDLSPWLVQSRARWA